MRWTIEPRGSRWSVTGMLRMLAISMSSMKSTAMMPCLIIRNQVSGSAVGITSRRADLSSQKFTVRRIIGSGDLWVTEYMLSYDDAPSYAVSIMEFREGLVAHETQYFADRFEPAPSRMHLVELR